MMSSLRKLFPLVLLVLLVPSANAQTYRASVRGTVYDVQRAVIPGATLKLTSQVNGETWTATSGAEGEYAISSLALGEYRLEAEAPGFPKQVLRITLLVNQEQRFDVTMEPGTTERVEIDFTKDVSLKHDSASIGTVIENREIVGLPLDGRNFYELTLLVPGAAPAAQGSADRCVATSPSVSMARAKTPTIFCLTAFTTSIRS